MSEFIYMKLKKIAVFSIIAILFLALISSYRIVNTQAEDFSYGYGGGGGGASQPQITSWLVDTVSTIMTLNFDVIVDVSTLNVVAISIQNDVFSPTQSYTLTGGTTVSVDGTSVIIDMNNSDTVQLNSMSDILTTVDDSYLVVPATLISDLLGTMNLPILDTAALQATSVTVPAAGIPGGGGGGGGPVSSIEISFSTASSNNFESIQYPHLETSVDIPEVHISAAPIHGDIAVDYVIELSSTATFGSDYNLAAGVLTFTLGSTLPQAIPLDIIDDLSEELDETIVIRLNGITHHVDESVSFGVNDTHTYTINDNDVIVQFTYNSSNNFESIMYPHLETSGPTTEVQITKAPLSDVVVDYQLEITGTATNSTDFELLNGTLLFPAGGTLPQAVPIKVFEDSIEENFETIIMTLTNVDILGPGSVMLGTNDLHTYTIMDNDVTLEFAYTDSNNFESITHPYLETSGPTMEVHISKAPEADVYVDYSVNLGSSTATQGSDFMWLSGQLHFPAGSTIPRPVPLVIYDDKFSEVPESVVLELSNAWMASSGTVNLGTNSHTYTINDNDEYGIIVDPQTGITTSEDGTTDSFTVVLSAVPTADVSITLADYDPKEIALSTTQLVFTPANALIKQTVIVTGLDDQEADGDIYSAIELIIFATGDPNFLYKSTYVDTLNMDNDHGIVVNYMNSGDLKIVTKENGYIEYIPVYLTSNPSSDVTINFSVTDDTEAELVPSSLTFNSTNGKDIQYVRVVGLDDDIADGNIDYKLVISPAVSSDPNYNGLDPDDINAVNLDDDSAGISLVKYSSSLNTLEAKTSEYGDCVDVLVILNKQNTADVTVEFSISDGTEATLVSPQGSIITFGSNVWPAEDSVYVCGVDDSIIDGDISYMLNVVSVTSNDTNYSGLQVPSMQIVNLDNDVNVAPDIYATDINVDPIQDLGPTPGSFVAWQDRPFTIHISASDRNESDIVSLRMITDSSTDINPVSFITSSPPDDQYLAIGLLSWTATNNDLGLNVFEFQASDNMGLNNTYIINVDVRVPPAVNLTVVSITDANSSSVVSNPLYVYLGGSVNVRMKAEDADTNENISMQMTLNPISPSAPNQPVFTAGLTANPHTSTLTWTPSIDDPQGIPLPFTFKASSASDNVYETLFVIVENTVPESGITIVEPVNKSIIEGSSADLLIVLTGRPSSDVTVQLSSSNATEGTTDKSELVFTNNNALTAQTVKVMSVQDNVFDTDKYFTISVGPLSSSDPSYNNLAAEEFKFTSIDSQITPGTTGSSQGGGGGGGSSSSYRGSTGSSGGGSSKSTSSSSTSKSTSKKGKNSDKKASFSYSEVDFIDVLPSNPAFAQIVQLSKMGVIKGMNGENLFKPQQEIDRAQALKILLEITGVDLNFKVAKSPFNDVNPDDWFAPYISYAKRIGYIQGYADGNFIPWNLLNRAEAVKIALEILEIDIPDVDQSPFADVDNEMWYMKYIAYAGENGLFSVEKIDGKIYIDPTANVTREEFVYLVMKLWESKQ